MRLRFSPSDDEAAFSAARDTLLSEVARWLDASDEERAEVVGDIRIFLDWRYNYSTGLLDEFTDADIEEFLLGWCPRKLSVPPGQSECVCRAVGAYIEFMADTQRLVGGVGHARALSELARELAPAMREAMDDPANFGMAKSLFAGLGDVSEMSDEQMLAALQSRVEEHNALPLEQRRAATDRFFEQEPEPEPYELPFVHIPPPPADVAAAAAAAPLPAKVAALREYLGPAGKPLTGRGNLKLADGRALIELLDTGDQMDPRIGDRTFRTSSTADLPHLRFLLEVAKDAGAVRVHQRRLVPTKAWARRSAVQQATALIESVIQLGPLSSRVYYRNAFFDDLDQFLDEGIALWLSPLLLPDSAAPFADLVEVPKVMVAQQLTTPWLSPRERIDEQVERNLIRIFEALEVAGVLLWTDWIETAEPFGFSYKSGGTVALTALGRHVLPDYVDRVGLVLHRLEDLSEADATVLIDAMLSVPDTQHESVVAAWQPNLPALERVRLLTEAITAVQTAGARLIGFAALDMFDIGLVEPLVRQLLDTPVSGNAAMWLMAHERADMDSLGGFVDIGAMVDIFAVNLDDPDELCDLFTTGPDADQPFRLLDGMWRHPAPETAQVLDVLGEHLTDRKLAKAARKAAMRHRSWMANRG
ncbi:hypothetical protein ABW16_22170 [Mycolicibacter heraklionensis]|uniref:Uncharacterized protein n=1 Tax=Mycolicibacter heraklionensis TaxID=512402 RepID=A0ABR5F9Q4_9MYCO|nr:hypothetical protein [Mycolicibacter heraklionensis]KLO25708.1 hypothetical protein ABW16_22170 [Mycolicibacter heraklionensis]